VIPTLGGVAEAQDKAPAPKSQVVSETAPDSFKVKFHTSKGDFVVQVDRAWAPVGADRFYTLVKKKFFDGNRFFRVLTGFIVQWGINGNPLIAEVWSEAPIQDDPVKQSNVRGTITYAKPNAPNRRTTQVFINLGDNARLDSMGFAAFGKVIEGMDVVDQLYAGYGEGPPNGNGPYQQRIQEEGNVYLNEFFPKLDYIETATILP
jgi:peptidyl-prolyl cis-trans isomerase A (cyclophilin A)